MPILNFLFRTKKGATRFDVIKNCLRIWVITKSKFNNKHEFAICILGDVCIWVSQFVEIPPNAHPIF